MPLIYQTSSFPDCAVGVWHGTESHEDLRGGLPDQWCQNLKGNEHRQLETLSARNALFGVLPKGAKSELTKDGHGKPSLNHNASHHFSLSHSHKHGAALVAKAACGVDLQKRVDKITRLRSKFERPDERAFVSQHSDEVGALHILWGAKEALFKLWGKRDIDWHRHLVVLPFDADSTSHYFAGKVRKGPSVLNAKLCFEWVGDMCLVQAISH